MRGMKKVVSGLAVLGIVASIAAPMASYALLTSYTGYRVYTGGQYKSYTWTNGYEAGGSVTNTVLAYIGDTSYAGYSTKVGENAVYSQGASAAMNAYHGIGNGNFIQYVWQAN